jgi:hypothetical protein
MKSVLKHSREEFLSMEEIAVRLICLMKEMLGPRGPVRLSAESRYLLQERLAMVEGYLARKQGQKRI